MRPNKGEFSQAPNILILEICRVFSLGMANIIATYEGRKLEQWF